ncbi:PHD finger protein 3-like [Anguilla rostrata]|uniref:PHD finger protein 3-like n=1 Tax=Anguilla rostrata TaxID=7938 RepID=UPI0030CF9F29
MDPSNKSISEYTGKPVRTEENMQKHQASGEISLAMKDELALENGAGSEQQVQAINPAVQPTTMNVELEKTKPPDLTKGLEDCPRSQKSSTCGVLENTLRQGGTLDETCSDLVGDFNMAQELDESIVKDRPPELAPFVNPSEVQEGHVILLSSSKATNSIGENKPSKDNFQFQKTALSGMDTYDADKDLDTSAVLKNAEVSKVGLQSLPKGKEGQDQNDPTKLLPSEHGYSPAEQWKEQRPSSPVSAEMRPSPIQPKRVTPTDTESIQTTDAQQLVMATKRQTNQLKTYPPSKKQRMQAAQDGRPVHVYSNTQKKQLLFLNQGLKPPEMSNPSLVSKTLPHAAGPDRFRSQCLELQPGISRSVQAHIVPRLQNPQTAASKSISPQLESSDAEERGEKGKMKKSEKILQRQRSKSGRSLPLEEPPLFIPDNAPTVKQEEDSIDSETVWDPTKHCIFCKKPHNSRFMVGCGRCDDWFHGECVGLDLAKAQKMEQEDQEYVCLKCCAEEDRKSTALRQLRTDPSKLEHNLESGPLAKQEKQRQAKPPVTGVRRDSVEMRQQSTKKSETRRLYDSDCRSGHTVKTQKPSGDMPLKTGMHQRVEMKTAKGAKCLSSLPAALKRPSVEQIRRNVRDSLKDILLKRLNESDLKVSTERAGKVAVKTEKELFSFFRDTDSKYKSKYRSLMFNLKDVKNNVLFKRVLKGEISPENLIHMSPEELASKELAAWRKRENRHTIEMIEKEQREVERRPITKITHKGEIEIENQEPVKEPEAVELEVDPVPRPVEEPAAVPQEMEFESLKDTTSQHKDHLFDLDCKICTGRMAPPVEDAATKVMKVATTVMWRQAGSDGETPTMSDHPDGQSHSEVVENVVNTRAISSEGRSDNANEGEDEAMFLARLQSMWKGFINMPSVAKFVTKAYPVSGILDHLTEDLPDSIQVGGRISPHTVWDYVEKIRASGTKEVCLIRFSPVTEEDEISYTLLYAYFSSRKRYGVVANNMKQVKDMYLIPLGSSEKIPHHLVPFDGPGLEAKRPSLLLGLIIRQRVKRDFEAVLPVDIPETITARSLPEKKTKSYFANDDGSARSEDMDFFSSLKIVRPKQVTKVEQSAQVDVAAQPILKTTLAPEASLPDLSRPLRFLPGVLSSPTLRSVDDLQQSLPCISEKDADKRVTAGDCIDIGSTPSKNLGSGGNRLERFVVKKKDPKTFQMESATTSNPNNKPKMNILSEKETADLAFYPRENPQDCSTEAVLAGLSVVGKRLENPVLQRMEGAIYEQPKSKPDQHPGFIAVSNRPEEVISACSKSSESHCPSSGVPACQRHSVQPELLYGEFDILGTSTARSFHDKTDHNTSHPGLFPPPSATAFPQGGHEPPQGTNPPGHIRAPELQYQAEAPPVFPLQSNKLPVFQPQIPPSVQYPSTLPPMFSQPESQGQNCTMIRPSPSPLSIRFSSSQLVPPESRFLGNSQRSSIQPQIIETQGPEGHYSDSWESQHSHSEDGYKQVGSTHHGSNRFHSDSHHE